MEVILRDDVTHLGKAGEVVTVKNGYARNYLIPRGLAYQATAGNKRRIEVESQRRDAQVASQRAEASELAERLATVPGYGPRCSRRRAGWTRRATSSTASTSFRSPTATPEPTSHSRSTRWRAPCAASAGPPSPPSPAPWWTDVSSARAATRACCCRSSWWASATPWVIARWRAPPTSRAPCAPARASWPRRRTSRWG